MMCNPPFYNNNDEFIGLENTRKPDVRSKAKSINTSKKCESIFDDGGEIEFVKNIIEDSIELGIKVK
jgi:23S rRNA A1618 N6-methylase RlmF